ncbi:MAG: plasmid mobilization relaxosome protein MobC [Aestuariibacter sp.]
MNSNPPYSIRFTQEQREYIRAQAQAMNWSEARWIRYRVFHDMTSTEAAQILQLLGKSRIANNLNQIAKELNTGTFIDSPDVQAKLDESYWEIKDMRSKLIKALGLRA